MSYKFREVWNSQGLRLNCGPFFLFAIAFVAANKTFVLTTVLTVVTAITAIIDIVFAGHQCERNGAANDYIYAFAKQARGTRKAC